jgi:hypothetical protein
MLDVVHPHLSEMVPRTKCPFSSFTRKRRVRQHLHHLALHLYRFLPLPSARRQAALEVGLLEQALVLLRPSGTPAPAVMKSIVTTTMISSDVPPK